MKPLAYFLIILLLSVPMMFAATYAQALFDRFGFGLLLIIAFYFFAMFRINKCFDKIDRAKSNTQTPEQFINHLKTLSNVRDIK